MTSNRACEVRVVLLIQPSVSRFISTSVSSFKSIPHSLFVFSLFFVKRIHVIILSSHPTDFPVPPSLTCNSSSFAPKLACICVQNFVSIVKAKMSEFTVTLRGEQL